MNGPGDAALAEEREKKMGIAELNWSGALKNLPLAIAAVRPDGGGMDAMRIMESRREQDAQRAERQRAADAEWKAHQNAVQLAEAKKRDLTARLVAFGRDVYGGKTAPTEQTAMDAMHRYGIDPMVGVKFMGEWARYRQTQALERQADAAIAKMKSGGGGGGGGRAYTPMLFRGGDGNLSWIAPGQSIPAGASPYSIGGRGGGIAPMTKPMSDADALGAFSETVDSGEDGDAISRMNEAHRTFFRYRAAGVEPWDAYRRTLGDIAPPVEADPESLMRDQAQALIAGGASPMFEPGGIAPPTEGVGYGGQGGEDAAWAAFQEEMRRILAEPDQAR